ncbi:MAG: formyltransferase family protein [Anaerolineae bacterium]|jgi:methionyl-tRNA formyltransferase
MPVDQKLHFAFLVLQEHPYGREMLRILLGRGFQPRLVLAEDSPLADLERQKFLTRIAGQPEPPTSDDLLSGLDIPYEKVANHNDPVCQSWLADLQPELLVLGGTRILRPPLLAIPRRGTVNAHPGLLPQLRGSSSVGWALYKDLPIGASTHFVEAGIDTGPIILRRSLAVYRTDTYERLVRRTLTLAGELMAETLALFAVGEVRGTQQDPAAGETLRVIPPECLAQAKTRLAQGCYSHFADGES